MVVNETILAGGDTISGISVGYKGVKAGAKGGVRSRGYGRCVNYPCRRFLEQVGDQGSKAGTPAVRFSSERCLGV